MKNISSNKAFDTAVKTVNNGVQKEQKFAENFAAAGGSASGSAAGDGGQAASSSSAAVTGGVGAARWEKAPHDTTYTHANIKHGYSRERHT